MTDSIGTITGKRIFGILATENVHKVRRELSELRRGIGKAPGELPELWGYIFEDFPEEYMGRGSAPSREEWAYYTAMTPFAMHQQGHSAEKEPMHEKGVSFGQAVRKLAKPNDADSLERVRKRFNICASSADFHDLAYYLRGLIQQMRAAGIAFDYGMLADDLFFYQFPDLIPGIRLRWGQDFYRMPAKAEEDADSKAS